MQQEGQLETEEKGVTQQEEEVQDLCEGAGAMLLRPVSAEAEEEVGSTEKRSYWTARRRIVGDSKKKCT